VECRLRARLKPFRQFVQNITELVEPASLLAGLRPHEALRVPEADRAVAHRKNRCTHPALLEIVTAGLTGDLVDHDERALADAAQMRDQIGGGLALEAARAQAELGDQAGQQTEGAQGRERGVDDEVGGAVEVAGEGAERGGLAAARPPRAGPPVPPSP